MRLYSRMNAGAVDDPEFGHFDADEHGAFDVADELGDRLLAAHYKGKPMWETDLQRDERLHGEESARRRDPETLYNAVANIENFSKLLAGQRGGEASPEAAAETAAMREQMAAMAEQVEAMRAQMAAMERSAAQNTAGDEPAGGSDAEPPKSPRSRKSTPAAA